MVKMFKSDRKQDIEVCGKVHSVSFQNSGMKYELYVDGEYRETFKPGSFLSFFFGDLDDYSFSVGGAEVVVAMRFGRMRIAVDGVYTDNGEQFRAVLPLPIWGTVFVVATLLPPVVLNSTFFDIIIGACCAYMCTHFLIKNPDLKLSTAKRVVLCIFVTIASWLFFGMFMVMEGRISL